MSAESLLVVNVLPENEPKAQEAIQVLKQFSADVQVIYAYERNFRPCAGCNACWLVTPGVCAVKDGYEELLKTYLHYDTILFLSGTALRFVDHRMKNLLQRGKTIFHCRKGR